MQGTFLGSEAKYGSAVTEKVSDSEPGNLYLPRVLME
jgi:hypothetical protein